MKRKILVKLDITGATDTHCGFGGSRGPECRHAMNGCPFIDRFRDVKQGEYRRSPRCIYAEAAAKKAGSKCSE